MLLGVNLVLASLLVTGLVQGDASQRANTQGSEPDNNGGIPTPESPQPAPANRRASASSASFPATPFARMYSSDARGFASNLREIGCPEETVKDILVAEIGRRYHAREQALRPKPADHVPITWSANPNERKLFQRRQQAATIAREKAVLLREALGYEVPVAMPIYALTTSEQRFEDSLAELSPEKRRAVFKVHEDYWTKVEALRERAKGFWQSEDVMELERLKAERRSHIENLQSAP